MNYQSRKSIILPIKAIINIYDQFFFFLSHLQMIFEKVYNRQNSPLLQTFLSSSQAQSVESQLYILNNVQNKDIQQNCIERLRSQREKIEELANKNEMLQKEVSEMKDENAKQKEIVEELEEKACYREFYENLKEQFEKILNSHQMAEFEIDELKIQLQNVVTASLEESQELKNIIRRQKESHAINITHLENIIADKQGQLKKTKRQAKSMEQSLMREIQDSKEENQKLREHMKEQGTQLEQNQTFLKREIKTKEIDLLGYEKMIQKLKKQINLLKLQITNVNFEREKEREEYLEVIQQSRTALRLVKKDKQEKDSQNNELKDSIKRYESKNKSLEENVANMKNTISKMKNQSQKYLNKQSQTAQQERNKLQSTIIRLKKQIQKHVEDHNLLSIEYKRLKSLFEQKDHHQKQRKTRLMSQFRQIDKIQKQIHRIK